ncbi:MAG: Smr/MutS family protein [Proteobacteria bacterium]|nr:Smr/MutS family protein [Pseudomonadota bacterium]
MGQGPGDLSQEDRDLWRHVTRDAKPLKKREPAPRAAPEPKASAPEPEAPAPEAKPKTAKPARLERAAPRPAPPAPVKPAAPALAHGRAAGVDRRSAQRLTRGQLPVEAALDLHGHTQDQAHAALERFLSEVQARGLRCVLVITGKGTTKEAGGVLRAQVPRWLNEPANRARILAFDYAQPKDGGLGALYVLIRRKRGG